jgi:hypothetical protein
MSTTGCFSEPTVTAYDGPVPATCTAQKRLNQQCKECAPAYDDDGNWKGYAVCASVPWKSACTCEKPKTASCADKGACAYYY